MFNLNKSRRHLSSLQMLHICKLLWNATSTPAPPFHAFYVLSIVTDQFCAGGFPSFSLPQAPCVCRWKRAGRCALPALCFPRLHMPGAKGVPEQSHAARYHLLHVEEWSFYCSGLD